MPESREQEPDSRLDSDYDQKNGIKLSMSKPSASEMNSTEPRNNIEIERCTDQGKNDND